MSRIYEGRGSEFVGEDLFRSAWFAYVNVQNLDDDMKCPSCGDNPENIIWDGVTLAFGRKHVTNSLKPPTSLDPQAPERRRRYCKNPQWFPAQSKEKPFRKEMVEWLRNVKRGIQSFFKGGDRPEDVGGEEKRLNGDRPNDDTEYSEGRAAIAEKLQTTPQVANLFREVFPATWKEIVNRREHYVRLWMLSSNTCAPSISAESWVRD
ncbi:hypothetical protein MPER_07052 [Moniliophthora perniciosa FA553]|nr:hypothetical protein MPER_07052 [Moniliophthora perniciosa FA553]